MSIFLFLIGFFTLFFLYGMLRALSEKSGIDGAYDASYCAFLALVCGVIWVIAAIIHWGF